MALWLAACGSSGGDDSSSGGTSGGTETGGTGGGGDINRKINMFTWAEYDDLDLLKSWGTIHIDIYNSNEEAIQKLASAKGNSGYDMVVPTGVYIPQMSSEKLLQPLDLSKIPNFSNLDPQYTKQSWDPDNKYSVCKDWGTTGWIYDTTVVKRDIKTWNDFLDVAQKEASGNLSVIDSAPDLTGIYFWANGIDWTTTKQEDLDACEDYLVNTLASHIKAFDSYPGVNLAQGSYALSQVFSGDARQGLIAVGDAGGDPEQYKWGMGSPTTELWMDNWCIVEGAKNVDGAHDFINFILDPENSAKDLEFHGYPTGIKGIEDLVPEDLPFKEIVFFTPEQVATMQSGAVNEAQDRLVQILDKTKAKAGG
jgi:spermidine/putrescine transport system substrate-binding protein